MARSVSTPARWTRYSFVAWMSASDRSSCALRLAARWPARRRSRRSVAFPASRAALGLAADTGEHDPRVSDSVAVQGQRDGHGPPARSRRDDGRTRPMPGSVAAAWAESRLRRGSRQARAGWSDKPTKKSSAGIARRPRGPTTLSTASRQTATAGSSAAGSACARLPPSVPRIGWPGGRHSRSLRRAAVEGRPARRRARPPPGGPSPDGEPALAGADIASSATRFEIDEQARSGQAKIQQRIRLWPPASTLASARRGQSGDASSSECGAM